jgi:iron complex outermembrane receptor protein
MLPFGMRRFLSFLLLLACVLLPAIAVAQSGPPQVTLPTVTVSAQKEPADPQTLPLSVTGVSSSWLEHSRITWIGDAAVFAPNLVFTDFSARKLSNPRVRGIGASPANPAVSTYLDGVPVLNANASSIEFAGVEQVEFVRGPQSALFGRNTLGGVINIVSERPSLAAWNGEVIAPFGNVDARELRGTVSGPIGSRVAVGFALGHAEREGFTVNSVTGHDLDSRSSNFGKAQLLYTPSPRWETRVIASGERAEDGDYALNDLDQVRSNPFVAARDFEGYTHRDLFNTTVLNRYEATRFSVVSTTGFVNWDTDDQTDLDYTPVPLARRSNVEEAFQFTQEVRVASSPAHAIGLSPRASLRWQAGFSLFTQDYEQEAVNTLSPFVLSPEVPFTVQQTSPRAALDDVGVGLYGQGTLAFNETIDLTVGARFDHESHDAVLETFFTPAVAPPASVAADRSFTNVSPQFALAYRVQPGRMVYASVARGFKAGGFNPASPAGFEAFDEEHTWNVEGGVKTSWANGRVLANAAVFFTDWADVQLNVPNPLVPAQFYITNAGNANSAGIEFELSARPAAGVDVFSTFGLTHARFDDGTIVNSADLSGNELPFTPDFTFSLGANVTHRLTSQFSLYGGGELWSLGAFHYDEANTAAQDAYTVVNLRAGARGRWVFGEVWVRNAFDTRYVPVALPYPGQTPSGFLGEPGRPRTYGVSVGVTF